MSYHFQVWLRGYAKDRLRVLSGDEDFHPHITLARPFYMDSFHDDMLKAQVIKFCEGKPPIRFCLEGNGNFDSEFYYVPVTQGENLLAFNDDLENMLSEHVHLFPKLNEQKILHATLKRNDDMFSCEPIEQSMLRLTGIRNKQIWFSYDFVTGEVLSRTASLDKKKWYQSVHRFSEQYHLLPTRNGFREI